MSLSFRDALRNKYDMHKRALWNVKVSLLFWFPLPTAFDEINHIFFFSASFEFIFLGTLLNGFFSL